MKYKQIRNLDNSPRSFELLKEESEKFWAKDSHRDFTIQPASKWNKGLSEEELIIFQKEIGFEFPESLKNYYRTMNGLYQSGINNSPQFYSYPADIKIIQKQITHVMEDNCISDPDNAPKIFPVHFHRFLIIDKDYPVLSMVGSDIILWGDNLAKALARDIFNPPFKKMKIQNPRSSFWVDKIIE